MRAGLWMIAVAACGPSVAPETPSDAPVIEIATTTDEEPDEVLPELEKAPPAAAALIKEGVCDSMTSLALKTAITARSHGKVSAGMRPDGLLACEAVNEGHALERPLTLAPGRCYTILAASLPNVTEVDMELRIDTSGFPPSMQIGPLARDTQTGPSALIGEGASCFRNPLPIPSPAKVVVTARTGAGPVAVMVYAK